MKAMKKAELISALIPERAATVGRELERRLDPDRYNMATNLMYHEPDGSIICRVLLAMEDKEQPTMAYLRLVPEAYSDAVDAETLAEAMDDMSEATRGG